MWYVVQVEPGREERARALIQAAHREAQAPPAALHELFVPRAQVERKVHGAWRISERPMFPGYVIADSRDPGTLNGLLAGVPAFTRILGGEASFVPLDRSEVALIGSLTDVGARTVRLSRAVAEGDSVRVLEGPLKGREGMIARVSRRKGTAAVRMEAFGRTVECEVGLAVMAKVG